MSNLIKELIIDVISGRRSLKIPIVDDDGGVIGTLRPLNVNYLSNVDILTSLTIWRSKNMGMFLTQFVATPERTKNWLENVVFRAQNQLLFLIYEADNLVGQVGFKDLTYQDGVVDGGMRGNSSLNPKILTYAHKSLIRWLFENAKIASLYGWLIADNPSGIMMNKQIGWHKWEKFPLIKSDRNGEVLWAIGAKDEIASEAKYCFKLTFYSKR
jgi:hypothetical protein